MNKSIWLDKERSRINPEAVRSCEYIPPEFGLSAVVTFKFKPGWAIELGEIHSMIRYDVWGTDLWNNYRSDCKLIVTVPAEIIERIRA